ncbi:MAG TPA: hypothetical protein OIM49_04110 [Clostridiaceae bacterium]|nr:hypothetical protein [Clostridiaceae bacterium]
MFKMKMMALLKNPAIKKSLIILAAIIVAIVAIVWPKSEAGEQINVNFRATSMNVKVGSKDVLMPEVYMPNDASATSKYNNVYCIQEGNNLSFATYNKSINLYSSSESSQCFKNYNQALWLVDNMYISTSEDKAQLLNYFANMLTSPEVEKNVSSYGNITSDNIKSLNKTVGNGKDSYGNTINRNLLETIEQLVLWNYTNNKSSDNFDTLVNAGLSGSNISAGDQNTCKYVYYALKYLANKNSNYTSNGTKKDVVTLDSSKAKIDLDKKQVGPYYLKANGIALGIDKEYKSKISATVTKDDNSTVSLKDDKVVVNSDGSFYINFAECGSIKKSELQVSTMYVGATTTATVIVNAKTQNLLNIKKKPEYNHLKDTKQISSSGEYSVVLIKVDKNGHAVTNNPATFSVTGKITKKDIKTNADGMVSLVANQKIESETAKDSYVIKEETAPEGFIKYDGNINLTVSFKREGTNYILDKDNVKVEGTGKNGTVKSRVPSNTTIEIYIPNDEEEKPKFDLALRKFISKVDGVAPTVSREPVIDAQSKTLLDSTGTAAYHHTKDSLKVKVGSKIEYTLRVYNEGEVDGYAKEITDYLPQDLKFVKIADESAKEYTTTSTSEDNKIVLKYNGNTVIKAKSIDRILNNEKDNLYQEVKVICEVKEGAKGYITNRAEITNYGYEDKGTWKEAKAINDVDRDSVQNTISNSLNLDKWYENRKSYSETDASGKTTTIKDYYPGEQDDDDFETVEVKELTGKYSVVIKKVDSSNKNQGLAGAYFTIDENSKSEKVGPTDTNGYIDVRKDITISKAGTQTVLNIKEETAPDGYKPYNGTISLTISAKESTEKYILDKENTKLTQKSADNEENTSNGEVTCDINEEKSLITITIPNEKKVFDLALRKWVTQAIVTENGQTYVTDTGHKAEDEPEEIVKVDLKKSKLNDVVVKFNYSIRVTNEGEIAGYAKEVSDYIPNGLKFVAEDNPDWTEKDGKIVTRALENTLLQPGESAEVKVLLTWINSANNMGVMTNTAEISEDYNDYGIPDRDSTPNNKVPGEDDIDDAPVMLTVKTGSDVIIYISVACGILAILGVGIFGIKKYLK